MYLFARGKAYVSEIASFYPDVSRSAIQNAAEVLEKDGVLVEGQQGNMRIYEFSPRCLYAAPLQLLLQAVSKCYSPEERQRLFIYRGAPRRKGKAVTIEKINATHAAGPDPTEQALLKNIRKLQLRRSKGVW